MKQKKNDLSFLWVWVISVVFWALYRAIWNTDELIEELFFKPLIFVLPVLIYIKYREKLTAHSIGLRFDNKKSIFLWGGLLGIFFVAESIAVSIYKHQPINYAYFLLPSLLYNAIVSLSTGISEEILYRGFLLSRLMKAWKGEMRPNLVVAILFAVSHIARAIFVLHMGQNDLLAYMWSLLLLGFADGLIYQQTGSVVAPIIAHSLWNFSNGFFIR